MALSKIKLRPKTVAFHIQNKTATNLNKSSMMLFMFGPSVTFHHDRMEATGPSPHPFCSSWHSHHFLQIKKKKNFLVKNAQQPTRRVPSCGAGGCIHRPVEAVRCLSCGARTLRKGLLRPNVFLWAKEWACIIRDMFGFDWKCWIPQLPQLMDMLYDMCGCLIPQVTYGPDWWIFYDMLMAKIMVIHWKALFSDDCVIHWSRFYKTSYAVSQDDPFRILTCSGNANENGALSDGRWWSRGFPVDDNPQKFPRFPMDSEALTKILQQANRGLKRMK